ncbi:MAG: hypothetical protein BWZ09_02467 [Alphaproteobacteria bacterium ADurb.BinA305]|nr:MAG: hypothetical protein BWZ09_02467 [Alphaproteobacteria bacterium ADurb.BinA305]
MRDQLFRGKAVLVVNVVDLVLAPHARFGDLDLGLALVVAGGVEGAAALRKRRVRSLKLALPGGALAARLFNLHVQRLGRDAHGVEVRLEASDLLGEPVDALVVGQHAAAAALDRAVELGHAGLERFALRGGVLDLLGHARDLDAALGERMAEFAVDAFQLLQAGRSVGGLFEQLVARADELPQLFGQRAARLIVARRLLGQDAEFSGHRVQPAAAAVGVAADRLVFAVGLSGLAPVLVQLLPRLVDQQGQLAHARGEQLQAAAVPRDLLVQRGELLGGVGDKHPARQRAGDLAVGHPELDAAVGVEDRAGAGDDAAAVGEGLRHGVERVRKENVAEQAARGFGEIVGDRHMPEQRRQAGLRRDRLPGRAVGDDEAGGCVAALGEQQSDHLARAAGVAHHDGVQPRAQGRLEREPQIGGRVELVRERAEHGLRVEPQRIGGVEKLLGPGRELVGRFALVGQKVDLRAFGGGLGLHPEGLVLHRPQLGGGGGPLLFQGFEPLAHVLGGRAEKVEARLGLAAGLIGGRQVLLQLAVLGRQPVAPHQQLALARLHLREGVLDLGAAALAVDRALAVLLELRAEGGDALLRLVDQGVNMRRLGLRLGHELLVRDELLAQRVNRGVQLADADVEGRQAPAGEEDVEAAQLVAQLFVFLRLAGLSLKRADLALHLADHVGEAQQVRVGLLDLAQGLFAVGLEFGDAGRLLEDRAAVFGLGGQDGVNLALSHDRVGGRPDARAHEQPVDVLEAAEVLVDEILPLAGPEHAAGDGDLVERGVQHAFAVGERDADLGHAERLAGVGAVEDHVRHLGAAQGGGALLAQHPADGVGDVALAAAVGADNRDHAGLELQTGLVGKALETSDFDLF